MYIDSSREGKEEGTRGRGLFEYFVFEKFLKKFNFNFYVYIIFYSIY